MWCHREVNAVTPLEGIYNFIFTEDYGICKALNFNTHTFVKPELAMNEIPDNSYTIIVHW